MINTTYIIQAKQKDRWVDVEYDPFENVHHALRAMIDYGVSNRVRTRVIEQSPIAYSEESGGTS